MLTRRNLISVSTLAAGLGLVPVLTETATAAPTRVTVRIGGEAVSRQAVLLWEARRLQVAAERLSQNLVGTLRAELDSLVLRPELSTEHVARDRRTLADVKLALGEDRIRSLLAADQLVSGAAGTVAALPQRWQTCAIDLTSSRGTAAGFARWFQARGRLGDERAMLVACPDHYLIRDTAPGVQEVIEVTGGAMLASRFVIDYSDNAGLPIPKDPAFPVRLAGWARGADGRPIGGVRHQFRNGSSGGFRAKLAVAFPATLPPWMISEHRWHLATEFSNWVTAYAATVA